MYFLQPRPRFQRKEPFLPEGRKINIYLFFFQVGHLFYSMASFFQVKILSGFFVCLFFHLLLSCNVAQQYEVVSMRKSWKCRRKEMINSSNAADESMQISIIPELQCVFSSPDIPGGLCLLLQLIYYMPLQDYQQWCNSQPEIQIISVFNCKCSDLPISLQKILQMSFSTLCLYN